MLKTTEQMIEFYKAQGVEVLPVKAFAARFRALGYTLDRSLDCRALSRFMTGEFAGDSYACVTTGIKESDTGLSAFHYQARRDSNFKALQALRGSIVSVSRNAILEA